jgi:hypothetical protein
MYVHCTVRKGNTLEKIKYAALHLKKKTSYYKYLILSEKIFQQLIWMTSAEITCWDRERK